jgi:hypothetical protein
VFDFPAPAPLFELQQLLLRLRIGQSKRHKVRSALLPPVWQVTLVHPDRDVRV